MAVRATATMMRMWFGMTGGARSGSLVGRRRQGAPEPAPGAGVGARAPGGRHARAGRGRRPLPRLRGAAAQGGRAIPALQVAERLGVGRANPAVANVTVSGTHHVTRAIPRQRARRLTCDLLV